MPSAFFLYFTDEQRQFPQTQKIPADYLWLADYVFFINRRFEKSLRLEAVRYAFYQELRSMRATGEYQAIWDNLNAAPVPGK